MFQVPDGRRVTTLLNATPIRAENGEVVSFVVTLQDMTPLQELERMRAEFLGMVSHELRTPLATIKGSTTTLLNSPQGMDPAVVTQFHRIIDQQVDHLQELIGDLLDVARVESGTLSIEPGPMKIAEVVDEARSRLLNSGARHDFIIDIPRTSPEHPPGCGRQSSSRPSLEQPLVKRIQVLPGRRAYSDRGQKRWSLRLSLGS